MRFPVFVRFWFFLTCAALVVSGLLMVHWSLGISPEAEIVAKPQEVSQPEASLEPGDLPGKDVSALVSDEPVYGADEERATRGAGEESVADILAAIGPLSDPANRNRAVEAVAALEARQRAEAEATARTKGWPLREKLADGRVRELIRVEEGRPLYRVTHNADAALSIAVTPLQNRPVAPLQGAGMTIGMWDGGTPRLSHHEFTNRAFNLDGGSVINHATHVGATAIGAGAQISARGMAVVATLDAYDWNNAVSEIISRAATAPGEPGKLRLSNHSYGVISGWFRQSGSNPAYRWYGSGATQTATEPRFGRYDTIARDTDSIAFNAPYYLQVWSAGNDRNDNPTTGQTVALSSSTTTFVSYNPAVHPAGDGLYRGGYDTISADALAKNVVTVGAVNDAVVGSQRNLSAATMSVFSSWGPTDDGRIKPDLVTNGVTVYSASSSGDNLYTTLNGTSMAAPGATGAAALLLAYFEGKFPGQSMRASTLKGLLLHTADNLGDPGPDYRFGWGLLNAEAAVEHIDAHHGSPAIGRIREATITTADTSQTYEFVWDGHSSIRATLVWADPAGAPTPTTVSDDRVRRLVNDLDLEVRDPQGTAHQPWVMPFVGTWTEASASLPATTGRNSTDNVEQVFIAAPPAAGVYQVVVSYTGSLTNNQQTYSLLLSGAADTPPPPPPLALTGVTPSEAVTGQIVVVDLAGSGFSEETTFVLTREGLPEISGESLGAQGGGWRVRFDLVNAASGFWSVVARREGGEESLLADGLRLFEAIWSENFDGAVSGWTVESELGSNTWLLTDSVSHSPDFSYTSPGINTRSLVNLVSPNISIPADATDLQLRFWNRYILASARHGGRLEIQVDGGEWRDIEDPQAGTVVLNNGYSGTLRTSNPPRNQNPFAGERAWTGNSGGFVETVIGLAPDEAFVGRDVRFRWRMATDQGTTSSGWWIDSIFLAGNLGNGTAPPTILEIGAVTGLVSADGLPLVSGVSIALFAAAETDAGEESLTYSWTVDDSPGVPVMFSKNNTNAAKSTEATFSAAGDYTLTLRVTDSGGRSASGVLALRVEQTAIALGVEPSVASLPVFETLLFTARLLDQFGTPVEEGDPLAVEWSIAEGGTVEIDGVFSANAAGGPYPLMATSGSLSASASVTVTPLQASILLHDLEQVADGQPKEVNVTTTPSELPVTVTYNGSSHPPTEAGEYPVEAMVSDPNYVGGATAILILLPPPPSTEVASLEEWLALFFDSIPPGQIDLTADANASGWPTLADLVFGNNPAVLEPVRFFPLLEEDDAFLVLSYPLDARAEGLVEVLVEWSPDLQNWSSETVDLIGYTRIVETGAFRATDTSTHPPQSRVDRITLRFQRDPVHPTFLRWVIR